MDLPNDILKRIDGDYGHSAKEAKSLISNRIKSHDHLDHPRIIRCAIFLAEGSISGLEDSLDIAQQDPRDVMLYAEYVETEAGEYKRVRDFNNTFERAEENVIE